MSCFVAISFQTQNSTKDKALLEAAKRIAALEEELRHAKNVAESANRAADECRNTLREKGKKFASLQQAKQEAEAVALELHVSCACDQIGWQTLSIYCTCDQ